MGKARQDAGTIFFRLVVAPTSVCRFGAGHDDIPGRPLLARSAIGRDVIGRATLVGCVGLSLQPVLSKRRTVDWADHVAGSYRNRPLGTAVILAQVDQVRSDPLPTLTPAAP